MKPTQNLDYVRWKLAKEIEPHGIREVARWADLNPMRVSRFVCAARGDYPGYASDAATLFVIAGALGYELRLRPCERQGNAIEIARGMTKKTAGRKKK